MGLAHSPSLITDGLVFSIDAANTRSYSGTGITAFGLIGGIGGTLVNGVGFTSSNNGCFVFDGTSHFIQVPYSSTLWNGSTFTLSIWAYKSGNGAAGSRGIMISKDINYIEHAFNNKTMASFRNNTGQQYLIYGNANASLNEWRYYASTYDGTRATLYENGIATTSIPLTINLNNTSNPMTIGRWDGGGYNLNGNISQAYVYNRALSATEIEQNFEATRDRYGI
jgi:hypothetical protein